MGGMHISEIDYDLHQNPTGHHLHVALWCDGKMITVQFFDGEQRCGDPVAYNSVADAMIAGGNIVRDSSFGPLPYDLGTAELRMFGRKLLSFAADCAGPVTS